MANFPTFDLNDPRNLTGYVTPEEEALKPKKVKSEGEIPSPVNIPSGCSFHTRCAFKQKICMEVDPEMQEVEPGHFVRCHLCGKCK